MEPYINVIGNGQKTVKVSAKPTGVISTETLRHAFCLESDVVFGLFRNGVALECDGSVFYLQDGWIGAKFELTWEEARRSRPATPLEPDATKPKKPKIESDVEAQPVDGDLAASVARYALYYAREDNYKRCAIPLTTRLASTFRHGENKSLKIGDEITMRSWFDKNFEVITHVVKIIEEFDTIILQSDGADLCDTDLISDSIQPRKGMRYLLMGYSIIHNKTNHQSLSTGIIVSDVTRRLRYTGSSGSFKGDSGGSCWHDDGRLMGMQVEVEKVPHTKDDNGRPASPASGGRCCIIAIRDILGHIQDLLTPDSDGSYDE